MKQLTKKIIEQEKVLDRANGESTLDRAIEKIEAITSRLNERIKELEKKIEQLNKEGNDTVDSIH